MDFTLADAEIGSRILEFQKFRIKRGIGTKARSTRLNTFLIRAASYFVTHGTAKPVSAGGFNCMMDVAIPRAIIRNPTHILNFFDDVARFVFHVRAHSTDSPIPMAIVIIKQ